MKTAVLICLLLSGCTQSFIGICGVVPMGQSDQGIVFARVHCIEEAAK